MRLKLIELLISLYAILLRQTSCSSGFQISAENSVDEASAELLFEKEEKLFLKEPSSSKVVELNVFLYTELSKLLLNQRILKPVLQDFERWLTMKNSDMPLQDAFAKILRLDGPSDGIGDQAEAIKETFKNQCFLNLGSLALEFKLPMTLVGLTHLKNVPKIPEMCPYILLAKDYINFADKDKSKDYVESLKLAKCNDDNDYNIIKDLSLDSIELMHEYGHLRWLFTSTRRILGEFIRANDPEKFEFFISNYPDHNVEPYVVLLTCKIGSHKLLDKILTIVKGEIDDHIIKGCAKSSQNVETLTWVYQRFNVLPDHSIISLMFYQGSIDMIKFISANNPQLIENGELIEAAMLGDHWDVIKLYAEKFPNSICVDKIIKPATPFETYNVLESMSIIKPENLITIPELLEAIKLNKFGFLQWALQDKNINFDLKEELLISCNFKDAVEKAIKEDYFNVLELVYKVVEFKLESYLKFAFQQGQIHIVKWVIQEIIGEKKPISDESLIKYFSEHKEFLPSNINCSGQKNIIKYGSLLILKYVEEFSELNLKFHTDNDDTVICYETASIVKDSYEPNRRSDYSLIYDIFNNGNDDIVSWLFSNKNIIDTNLKRKLKNDFFNNCRRITPRPSRPRIEALKRTVIQNGW